MNCILKKTEKKVYINTYKNFFVVNFYLNKIFFFLFENYLFLNNNDFFYLFKNLNYFKNFLYECGILK